MKHMQLHSTIFCDIRTLSDTALEDYSNRGPERHGMAVPTTVCLGRPPSAAQALRPTFLPNIPSSI